jgi:hypothetical protein
MKYNGFKVNTEKDITKDDIITICKLLNSIDQYSNSCEFVPAPTRRGGILYKFKHNQNKENDDKWYKAVRFGINYTANPGKWYWVNQNVMSEWSGNDDIIFNRDDKFSIDLMIYNGAPKFTLDELKMWEECFNEIGIVRVGKYPSKKSLQL